MEERVDARTTYLKSKMKLKSLKIKNFRSYRGESQIDFSDNITSIVGKNDVGKSTMFDALDIFFDNKKPDISDLCVDSEEKLFEITCVFNEIPAKIQIDENAETSLQEEYLVNEDDLFEVKKVYRCADKSISSTAIYITCNYPSGTNLPNLHSLNQESLKSLAKGNGIEVEDARQNHLWRKAIWANQKDLFLVQTDLKIDDFDRKARDIYSKIESIMPLLFVFRADREMTDGDSEAKDPMQIAVAEAQLAYQAEIDQIKDKIQEKVEEVADLALEKLKEIDPDLAQKLNPVLKSKPSWKFEYKIEDDKGVALNKRGSGTRRLVLLNFFRAQSEKQSIEKNKGIIYAIEEPETSQHPDNQKLIIDALTGLAKNENKQVIITTHSPELLRELETSYTKGIRFIQCDSEDNREVITGNDALILSANALGILSKQQFGSAEKIVLVEGIDDCVFLEHTAKAMKDADEIQTDLFEAKVEVLPVGGCPGIKKWLSHGKHESLGLKTYVFLDSDRKQEDEDTENTIYINSLTGNPTISGAFCTKKREIENYISSTIINCKPTDYEDAKTAINYKTGVNKRKIIETFWNQMTSDLIDEEIKNIVKKILEVSN